MSKKNNYVAKYGRTINRVFHHCTGGSPNASVQAILNFWKRPKAQGGNGWRHPGYHILIDKFGKEHELALPQQVTNGVRGYNWDSYHIAYIGGANGVDTRTPAQKEAQYRRTKWAIDEFGKNIEIWGHRDFSKDLDNNGIITPDEYSKDCPSFDTIAWLNATGLYNYLLR